MKYCYLLVFLLLSTNGFASKEDENHQLLKSRNVASLHTEKSCEYQDAMKLAEAIFKHQKNFYAQNPLELKSLLTTEFAEVLTKEYNCIAQGELCAIDADPWTGAQDGEIKEPISFTQTGETELSVTVSMSYFYVLSESQQQNQRVSMTFKKEQPDSCWLLDDFITPGNMSLKNGIIEYFLYRARQLFSNQKILYSRNGVSIAPHY